ncbi:DUF4376 domain-containing protein [Neisseria subflava]|uniref:DUF4376 domain-containing protein n=2 Tax=Neisseria subflava TaxID=28449 RepID=UPI00202AAC57|nr:DUF4376 domain-containing protein [Neisseria subflava]MCL9786692.1 DUF4376 domain-containing protein [Neisseria subflava]MCL9786751.1 DUF4376 domain-containing protein [Neisseria subflava]
MTMYYYQNGFLHTDDTPPEGAVALTAAEHEALVVGQCTGQIVMPGKDGKPVLADPAPCPSSTWDGEQWHIDPECAARLKAEQQDEMWERIKAKRYDNLRHGVFVKSVGKWFQTDDASRTQYLALAVMPRLPEKLPWKTMDNSFVNMTKALLGELMEQMLIDEQADFANAERHKAAMEKAEHPLEYDYSDGWTANFDEQAAAELEDADK